MAVLFQLAGAPAPIPEAAVPANPKNGPWPITTIAGVKLPKTVLMIRSNRPISFGSEGIDILEAQRATAQRLNAGER